MEAPAPAEYGWGMAITGNQIAAARALVGLSQTDLARRAGLTLNTIVNLEASEAEPVNAKTRTLFAVQRALDELGVEFINHQHPGVRLRGLRP